MRNAINQFAPTLYSLAMISSAMAEEAYTPPPVSITCMAVLVGVSVEVGRLCLPNYNPEGQGRLQTNLKKIESRLVSSSGWDEERVDQLLKEEGARSLNNAQICAGLKEDDDTLRMIKGFIDAEPVKFDREIDTLVARLGDPTKGDCI